MAGVRLVTVVAAVAAAGLVATPAAGAGTGTGTGTTTFTTRLAAGRAVLRVSIARPGDSALISATLTVRVAATRRRASP
jgi:hypothetical protein